MPQDEQEDGFWSKADSYQPKTPAMKSWKKKYLEDNQSKYGIEQTKKIAVGHMQRYPSIQLNCR